VNRIKQMWSNLFHGSTSPSSGSRFFVGYCWGGAGSTWVARLLNAHPDILCMHAPILPRFDHMEFEDAQELLSFFFEGELDNYPFLGFTHGVSIQWAGRLEEQYGSRLRSFVLIREPVARLRSVVALQSHLARDRDEGYQRAMIERWLPIWNQLCERSGRDLPRDYRSMSFYYAVKMLNEIEAETETGYPIFRLEDLVSKVGAVYELFAHVAPGAIRMAKGQIRRIQRTKVGAHATEAPEGRWGYNTMPLTMKVALDTLLTDKSRALYRMHGYDLPKGAKAETSHD
jgi:hypothetical protein